MDPPPPPPQLTNVIILALRNKYTKLLAIVFEQIVMSDSEFLSFGFQLNLCVKYSHSVGQVGNFSIFLGARAV